MSEDLCPAGGSHSPPPNSCIYVTDTHAFQKLNEMGITMQFLRKESTVVFVLYIFASKSF